MAGGSTAPSFQRERLGRAGCVFPHLYLRSAHTWAPDETCESSVRVPYTAVVKDGFTAPACVRVVVTSGHVLLCSRRTAEAGPGRAGFRGSFPQDGHVARSLNLRGS